MTTMNIEVEMPQLEQAALIAAIDHILQHRSYSLTFLARDALYKVRQAATHAVALKDTDSPESTVAVKSCPFCGSSNLSAGHWHLNEGEVDAWECQNCYAGAPADAWNAREHERKEAAAQEQPQHG